MTAPTRKVIRDHLARKGVPARYQRDWAAFLHGLDWPVLRPLVQISVNTKVHPAITAAKVAEYTQDQGTRALLQGHIRTKAAQAQAAATPEG